MQTPEEWAEEIEGIIGHGGPAVEQVVRDAMRSVYEDVINFIDDEDFGDDQTANIISHSIQDRMLEILGEDY